MTNIGFRVLTAAGEWEWVDETLLRKGCRLGE
jgi:hypothetical protein